MAAGIPVGLLSGVFLGIVAWWITEGALGVTLLIAVSTAAVFGALFGLTMAYWWGWQIPSDWTSTSLTSLSPPITRKI